MPGKIAKLKEGVNKRWLRLFLLPAIIAFGYYMLADEEVKPEIRRLQTAFNQVGPIENNGEVYRLGMWIDFSHSPFQVGKHIVEKARLSDGVITQELVDTLYPPDNWLADIAVDENTSPLLCDLQETSCLTFIWQHSAEIKPFIQQYQPYINRYSGLMAFDFFLPLAIPSLRERNAFSELDLLAVNLMLLQVIDKLKAGDTAQAVSELSRLMQFQYTQMADAVQVIPKVINLTQYKLTLKVAAFLLAKTPVTDLQAWQPIYARLTPINDEALSMQAAYLREVAMFANDIATYLPGSLPENHSSIFLWLKSRLFYKHNKTLNAFYDYIQQNTDRVVVENGRFIERDMPDMPGDSISLNNFLGNILLSVSAPRFIDVRTELPSLNYLHSLYQLAFDARITHSAPLLNSIKSPYTGEPAFIADKQLCVAGEEESAEDICLYFASR